MCKPHCQVWKCQERQFKINVFTQSSPVEKVYSSGFSRDIQPQCFSSKAFFNGLDEAHSRHGILLYPKFTGLNINLT